MERFGMVIKDRHAIAIRKCSEAMPQDPVFCFVMIASVLVLVHIHLIIRLTEMAPVVYRGSHELRLHQSKHLNFPPPFQPTIPKHDTLQKDPSYYPFEYTDFLGKNKQQNKSHE